MNPPIISETKEKLLRLVQSLEEPLVTAAFLSTAQLVTYYETAKEASGEDPKTRIRQQITLDDKGKRQHVKVKIAFSSKATSDESESWIDDPNQTRLDLDHESESEVRE